VRATTVLVQMKKWSYDPCCPLHTSSRSSTICAAPLPLVFPIPDSSINTTNHHAHMTTQTRKRRAAATTLETPRSHGGLQTLRLKRPFCAFCFHISSSKMSLATYTIAEAAARLVAESAAATRMDARQPVGHLRCSSSTVVAPRIYADGPSASRINPWICSRCRVGKVSCRPSDWTTKSLPIYSRLTLRFNGTFLTSHGMLSPKATPTQRPVLRFVRCTRRMRSAHSLRMPLSTWKMACPSLSFPSPVFLRPCFIATTSFRLKLAQFYLT
jgi:hypothetical protein